MVLKRDFHLVEDPKEKYVDLIRVETLVVIGAIVLIIGALIKLLWR